MLNPKLVLALVGIVALAATQLVDSNSTIASIASADGQQDITGASRASSDTASSMPATSGTGATEQLNFEQPDSSAATLSDFYGAEEEDSGFTDDAGNADRVAELARPETIPVPRPAPVRQAPTRASRAAPSPSPAGGMPSNGRPDQPIDIGPPPPGDLGL